MKFKYLSNGSHEARLQHCNSDECRLCALLLFDRVSRSKEEISSCYICQLHWRLNS